MRERLFPRWCTALFALLPMSELLYLAADGQSVYAAALACTVCALAGIGAARLSDRVRHSAPAQWVLALTSLFPLLASIARMSIFLQKTVFTGRSCGSTVVLLTVCILLMASMGLNRCAMWHCRLRGLAGTVLLLSGVLTFTQLTPASFPHRQRHCCRNSGIFCIPATGIGRTGVFFAGDQAVRKRVARTQRRRCIARTPAAAHSAAAWS